MIEPLSSGVAAPASRRTIASAGRHGVLAGSAIVLVGTFLPWVQVGSRSRSSYVLTGVLHRLELAPGGGAAAAVRLWPVMPLLLVCVVVGTWTGRHLLGAGFGAAAGLYAALLAIAVGRAPVAIRSGVATTIAGAVVLLASSAVLLASRHSAWRTLTRPPTRHAAGAPASGPPAGR